MSIEAEVAIMPAGEERGAPRRAVDFAAFLRATGAIASKVRVKDISSEGCRILGRLDVAAGTEIWLKLTGLTPMKVRIAWVKDAEAGGEFVMPLHPGIVADLTTAPRAGRNLFTPPVHLG
ncbi:MAG TPA: PilZ domain-containing protein [Allosphingosinicella sp.]|nr:PilZ domain-containing protein [Allosphingosinicella sp.]